MTKDQQGPSRRTVLGAIGASAFVPAAIAGAAKVGGGGWAHAQAAFNQARQEHAAASTAFDRMHAAWEPGQPGMDVIHWTEFQFCDRENVARFINVEEKWTDFLAAEGKTWWSANPDKTKATFRAALDSGVEFRRRESEHEERHGYWPAYERLEAAEDALTAAERALLATPAPNGEALLSKLELVLDSDREPWSEAALAPVLADARRLLSGGRA